MHGWNSDQRVQHLRKHVKELVGDVDTTGLELIMMVRSVAKHYEVIANQRFGSSVISGPRWILLLRLLGEERSGNMDGVTPTYLSRCQNVSKNTISALLRGLEKQGLIQRDLDSIDRRIFRIRLTEAGRQFINHTAPQDINRLNTLANGISPEEKHQLITLLGKLHQSLAANSGVEAAAWPHAEVGNLAGSLSSDEEVPDTSVISA